MTQKQPMVEGGGIGLDGNANNHPFIVLQDAQKKVLFSGFISPTMVRTMAANIPRFVNEHLQPRSSDPTVKITQGMAVPILKIDVSQDLLTGDVLLSFEDAMNTHTKWRLSGEIARQFGRDLVQQSIPNQSNTKPS